uniref:Uncharacterized protein n=1 Tax=Calcidiscus leptoporus TaxID=127549 RepID=A0A7S0J9Q2_9EUKA
MSASNCARLPNAPEFSPDISHGVWSLNNSTIVVEPEPGVARKKTHMSSGIERAVPRTSSKGRRGIELGRRPAGRERSCERARRCAASCSLPGLCPLVSENLRE